MQAAIEQMVSAYERGTLTRRELVGGLAALALGVSMAGQGAEAPAATFQATGLNHIALQTTNVAASRDFYVRHLGMTVSRESESSCFLTCGDHFLALFRSDTAGLHHYCYSMSGYDVEQVEAKLKAENLNPRRQGNRIYFDDPDGISVQLADDGHRA